ncbi:MAG TPA: PTS sugar transporter subunit IIA [Verrucomicrobiae bacterium]|nr:PTS sugar transporter subunit IIA [Verrucomicrobiae bacterium]
MSDSRPDQTPKTQPASAGGPPRPPKKTARGLGDGFPDDFFGSGVDIVDLHAQDRWQAIEELISHLVTTRKIQSRHRGSVTESIRKRESSMSTGIGFGIGIPHASTTLVSEVVAVVGRSRKGIQFDALDSKPVHLVFLFLVPTGQFQKHVHVLASVAKMLHRQDFRDGLSDRFM